MSGLARRSQRLHRRLRTGAAIGCVVAVAGLVSWSPDLAGRAAATTTSGAGSHTNTGRVSRTTTTTTASTVTTAGSTTSTTTSGVSTTTTQPQPTQTTMTTTTQPTLSQGSTGSTPPAPPAGYTTVYQSEFSSGVLGPEWYRYWGQPGGDPGGWWSPSHVDVTQGALTEHTYQDPSHYGGSSTTPWVEGGVALPKFGIQSGEILVRTRLTDPNGVATALLLWPSAANTWPPEIDFSETMGGSQAYAFLHWRSSTGIQTASAKAPKVDLTQWHTWGVIVTPSKLTFTVDGSPWATLANQQSQMMHLCIQQEVYAPGNPYGELAPGPSEPGEVDLDVAWVAVYASS